MMASPVMKKGRMALCIVMALTVCDRVFAGDADMAALLRQPTLSSEPALVVKGTLAVWEKALDHPLFMAKLWEIYGFQPAYRVAPGVSGIHVVDPSGIVGHIIPLKSSSMTRKFFGQGRFDHWAVPAIFNAQGLIIFQYRQEGSSIRGTCTILMKGDNGLTDFLIRLFSGIISQRIDKRFHSHMRDMQKIIDDITHDPQKIQNRLTGPTQAEFKRLFIDEWPPPFK